MSEPSPPRTLNPQATAFPCPLCGTGVRSEATECPSCGELLPVATSRRPRPVLVRLLLGSMPHRIVARAVVWTLRCLALLIFGVLFLGAGVLVSGGPLFVGGVPLSLTVFGMLALLTVGLAVLASMTLQAAIDWVDRYDSWS